MVPGHFVILRRACGLARASCCFLGIEDTRWSCTCFVMKVELDRGDGKFSTFHQTRPAGRTLEKPVLVFGRKASGTECSAMEYFEAPSEGIHGASGNSVVACHRSHENLILLGKVANILDTAPHSLRHIITRDISAMLTR